MSRLATISVAHLYNLRKRAGYLRHRQVWTKTRPVAIAIGERRAPAPNNRPGYLRVDSVHQSLPPTPIGGRPGRRQRPLPHQCRGLRDAV